MIQSIYTSVSNADVVPCGKKGQTIKSDPIPLLRNNYLGEYRTELEKAKVRKNLGIADDQTLQWGNIFGFIENQEDLVKYIESKWVYENAISSDIKTVEQALDYVIYFVSNFKSDNETIARLDIEVKQLVNQLELTKNQLQQSIDSNSGDINSLRQTLQDNIFSIEQSIVNINNSIQQINEDLKVINVDENILNWIQNSINSSNTITLNDQTLEVEISQSEKNAISLNNGLYVYDYSEDIARITDLDSRVQTNTQAIQDLESNNTYQTELTPETIVPNTVGGISQGTKVSDLAGKTVTEILDIMLFPTYVRPLIYPTLSYNYIPNLVEVGSVITKPELLFVRGDAGEEIIDKRENLIINPSGLEVSSETYNMLGTYTFKGTVYYNEGKELLNNKNEPSGRKVPAGDLSTSISVTTTYPWYTSSKALDRPELKQQ